MRTDMLRSAGCLAFALILMAIPSTAGAQKKVCINWSDQTGNAVSGGGTEDVWAGKVKDQVVSILKNSGFSVKTNGSSSGCNSDCNSWGADGFISIHSNAGGGHGSESWWHTSSNGQSWATNIETGLKTSSPYQSRGVKKGQLTGANNCGNWRQCGNFGVTRNAKQPATLVETVFHDCVSTSSSIQGHAANGSESSFLRSSNGQKIIGTGIANGVCQYFTGANCSGTSGGGGGGGTTPSTASLYGVIYQNGNTNDRVSGSVKLNTGATASYTAPNSSWSAFSVEVGKSYTVTASASGYDSNSRTCGPMVAGANYCSVNITKSAAPPAPTTTTLKGVIYQNGNTTDRVSGTVKLNTGASTSYSSGDSTWPAFTVEVGKSYTVTASASGYNSNSKNCGTAKAGEILWCSVQLTKTATTPPTPPTPPTPTTGTLQGVVYQNGNKSDLVAPATVTVSTGNRVTYDGNLPWAFTLSPGTYTVTVEASGYDTVSKTCPAITAGGTANCDVELAKSSSGSGSGSGSDPGSGSTTPAVGTLQGIVYQNGSTADTVAPAIVDLSAVGSTSFDGRKPWSFSVDPGVYQVTVTASGYEKVIRTCPAVIAGGTTSCDIELSRTTDSDSESGTSGGEGELSGAGDPSEPFIPGDEGASNDPGGAGTPGQYTVEILSGCSAAGSEPIGGFLFIAACLGLLALHRHRRPGT